MDTTHKSLLIRIRDRRDRDAWREFHTLYAPFLYRYARRKGLNHEDAEDVRAQCLHKVAVHIGTFEYQRERGGFRNWLRRLVTNKIIDTARKRQVPTAQSHVLREAVDQDQSPDEEWEAEWIDARLRFCIDRARHGVSVPTFNAFHLLVVQDKSVEDVCALLGMNANQVYKAKSSVLKRIRSEVSAFDAELYD